MSLFSNLKDKADKISDAVAVKLESHWDKILTKANSTLASTNQSIKNIIHDDAKLTSLFETVHGSMPLPFRLIVKQDAFVAFCLKNRKRFLTDEDE